MTSEKSSQPRPDTSATPASPGQQQTPPIGEGSYEGTCDYQKSIQTYLEGADVAADAQAARPADAAEAEALKQAEQAGLSHSRSPGQ